jgi:hypothetical protein
MKKDKIQNRSQKNSQSCVLLKGDLSNYTTFNLPPFSLVNTLKILHEKIRR